MAVFLHRPKRPNGLMVITDLRLKTDRDLDAEQGVGSGGPAVLEYFSPMKAALGAEVWKRTTRLALFDHGSNFLPPEGTRGKALTAFKRELAERRAAARSSALESLRELRPTAVLCLGVRTTAVKNKDAESGEALGHTRGSMAWDLFGAPAPIDAMAGTLWASSLAPVIGVPHPGSQEFVHGELFRRWCIRAAQFSLNPSVLLLPTAVATEPVKKMYDYLQLLLARGQAGAKISVDIESYMDGSVITCVGLSDGEVTVSVPWEEFKPHGTQRIEPVDLGAKALATAVLGLSCPKVLHNGISFDGPLLAQHGTPMAGPLIDTYLMHGAIRNQYKHGLQAVAAELFLVPPWKSLHRKSVTATGLTLDDAEAWIQDPTELRRYNASDTFYTAHIERALNGELI